MKNIFIQKKNFQATSFLHGKNSIFHEKRLPKLTFRKGRYFPVILSFSNFSLFFASKVRCLQLYSQNMCVGRSVCLSVGRLVCRSVCQKKFYSLKMTFLSKSQKMKVTQEQDWTLNKQPPTLPTTPQPPTQPPPTHPSTQLDKYVGDKIQFRPENKSFLTQCVNLKNILKLNPTSNQACFSPI